MSVELILKYRLFEHANHICFQSIYINPKFAAFWGKHIRGTSHYRNGGHIAVIEVAYGSRNLLIGLNGKDPELHIGMENNDPMKVYIPEGYEAIELLRVMHNGIFDFVHKNCSEAKYLPIEYICEGVADVSIGGVILK